MNIPSEYDFIKWMSVDHVHCRGNRGRNDEYGDLEYLEEESKGSSPGIFER